uniref:Uncharacterized protein n=1 Tax=Anguilla anguilla TaxID=7936 RepID=A0A0E9S0F2_ANGAN
MTTAVTACKCEPDSHVSHSSEYTVQIFQ